MQQSADAFFSPAGSDPPAPQNRPVRLPDGSGNVLRRVYIVDDDRAARQSLHLIVTALGYSVRPFLSGQDFLDEVDTLRPGCALLDLWMPGLGGIEVLKRMERRLDVHPVVILTGHADVPTAVHALKLGASDFLEKPPNAGLLREALSRAFETIDREHAANLALTHDARRVATLSERERQVLRGLGAGLPNKAIAADLGLSVRTIEMHRARMMDRLGVTTVAEVVTLAISLGFAGTGRRS